VLDFLVGICITSKFGVYKVVALSEPEGSTVEKYNKDEELVSDLEKDVTPHNGQNNFVLRLTNFTKAPVLRLTAWRFCSN
jgi:hypothetical protein